MGEKRATGPWQTGEPPMRKWVMHKALMEIAHHPLFSTLSEFDNFRQIQDIARDALKEVEGE